MSGIDLGLTEAVQLDLQGCSCQKEGKMVKSKIMGVLPAPPDLEGVGP